MISPVQRAACALPFEGFPQNPSKGSMEVWNHPDTTSLQVSTLILFHMLRVFMQQGTFAVVHFAA
jgi:hypothetical protein